jgi:DDE superfamily endonuclease
MTVATFVSAIIGQMPKIGKCQHDFWVHIIQLFLGIRGRINFKQMSRYGIYNETTYHNHFSKPIPFAKFNKHLIKTVGSGHNVLVFDPSYLPKSGQKTPNVGTFWSGCAGKMCHGIEIGVFSIIDVDFQTGFHLEAHQTPNAESLKQENQTLLEYYADLVVKMGKEVHEETNYLVVDAYFAKKQFIETIVSQTSLEVICRLRSDSKLKYLYDGPQKGRGRPRLYNGSVDVKCIDRNYFNLLHADDALLIWDAKVYSIAFKRIIRVAYVEYLNEHGGVRCYQMYAGTDLNLPGFMITKYYKSRFQIEFEIRDAKQFAGLTECQSRNEQKIDFHVNTSLTAVSVAKAVYWCEQQANQPELPFSMADVKSLNFNQLFLEKIFSMSPEAADMIKKHPDFHNLLTLGTFHFHEAA